MEITSQTPVLMLPGLQRTYPVLDGLLARVPNSRAVQFPDPLPREALPEYAIRVAPRLPRDSVILGVSFGGIVATELARVVQPRGLVLVSTIRNRGELRLRWRFAGILGARGCSGASYVIGNFANRCARWVRSPIMVRLSSFAGSDGAWIRWAMSSVATWKPGDGSQINCPTLQIHGSRDLTFPVGRTSPDLILDGGHSIAVTHTDEVVRAIGEFVTALGSSECSA